MDIDGVIAFMEELGLEQNDNALVRSSRLAAEAPKFQHALLCFLDHISSGHVALMPKTMKICTIPPPHASMQQRRGLRSMLCRHVAVHVQT